MKQQRIGQVGRFVATRRPRLPSGSSPRRAFAAFSSPNYRLYFLGQLVSQSGTWMQNIAQSWLVLELTNSALALGTVTALQFIPVLVLSLPGGVLADRVPKRRLLVITQTLAMLQAFVLAGLVLSHTIQLWHVYVMATVLGITMALGQPAQRALTSELVPPELVPNAVALNSALFNTARIAGPAMGGLALAVIGTAGCFLLNGVSFVFVIAALALLRLDLENTRSNRGNPLRQIGDAAVYVGRTPEIAFLLLLVGMVGTFGYNFNVVLPLLVRYELGTGAIGLGLFNSCLGLGSVVGSFIVAARSKPTTRSVTIGAAVFSVGLGLLAAIPWYQLTPVVLFILGLSGVIFTTGANTTVQLAVPSPLRGRVLSFYNLVFIGTTPLGASLTGLLAERWDVRLALGFNSLCCCLGVLLAMAYLRRVEHHAAPLEPTLNQAEQASG